LVGNFRSDDIRRIVVAAVSARGLTKVFRTPRRGTGVRGMMRSLVAPQWECTPAVDDVSFDVGDGELLALLGLNGAGKSTIIKMLAGIITPTSGTASVLGIVPYRERERAARSVGAVFGQRSQLWWDLPARESFAILRDIYGVASADYRSRLLEFDDLLDLSSFWDTRVRHLSLGQRVRCDLAAALLHDPPVVFLDEPTIGMDVVVKEEVRGFLRHQVRERNRAVLLTTHDMTEVSRLAERVVLIHRGRLAFDGSVREIRGKFGGSWRVRVAVTGTPASLAGPPPRGLTLLNSDGVVAVFAPEGESAMTAQEAMRSILQRYDVSDIAVEEDDLEDAMRAVYMSNTSP
jgi:viologen exporter family transport system ATP-binding protein